MYLPQLPFLTQLLDWFVPRDCPGCAKPLSSVEQWCPSCRGALNAPEKNAMDRLPVVVSWHFSGPVRSALHRLKYDARPDLASRLVTAGFPRSRPYVVPSSAVLVPVPLHPRRLAERGYNQSALLARALGRRWNVPVRYQLLARVVDTEAQVGKGRAERLDNITGAFQAHARTTEGRLVWLVDDVVTTGATVAACRTALDTAKIRLGGVLAVARASSEGGREFGRGKPAKNDGSHGPDSQAIVDSLRSTSHDLTRWGWTDSLAPLL